MEQKIFLLIAIFCIALVKSDEDYSEENYTNYSPFPYPVETGEPYPGDFPGAVLLSGASFLWGDDKSKHECFQEKYSNGSDYHKHGIEDFSDQLVEAVKETLEKVKDTLGTEQNFETLSQNISASAIELGTLLKEYQVKFSGLVEKGSFDKVQELITEYDEKIDKVEKTLDKGIRELKEKTTVGSESNISVKNLENTRNKKLTVLTDTGDQVIELLKKCIEEKKT